MITQLNTCIDKDDNRCNQDKCICEDVSDGKFLNFSYPAERSIDHEAQKTEPNPISIVWWMSQIFNNIV